MITIEDDPTVIRPALDELRQNFLKGKTLPISYRKQQLRNLIRGIEELEPKFHEALGKDLGINPTLSVVISTNITLTEVKECLAEIDHWTKPQCIDTPFVIGPAKSYIQPEPLGVALVIGAWNYPLALTIPYVATAISAGNCCIVKPSELSPYTSKVIAELVDKYLDKDCYRCIEGKVEVAKTIIKEPFDIIVFTGSTEKGKLVAKAAAENLIPCVLELGGKSPTIIDKDANLANAALRITQGRLLNCGQTCVACDYLFVHREIKEKLIQKVKETIVEFYGKDASKSADYSKIVNEFHVQRIKSYLDEDHGGKVIYGGEVNEQERYIAPTLVENPRENSKLMQEEIFGPVLPILDFDNIDDVIQYINERPKPLALYYYGSTSSANYKKIKTRTSSGNLMVNDSVFHFVNSHLPFGGVGFSGIGKLHGYNGFKSLSHFKGIMEKATINFYPFNVRYPPHIGSRGALLKLMLKYSRVKQSTVIKSVLLLALLGVGASLHRKGKLATTYSFLRDLANLIKTYVPATKSIL